MTTSLETDDIRELKAGIREVPDWPQAGISFKDLSPLYSNQRLFSNAFYGLNRSIIRALKQTPASGPDSVAAPEARGFIMGSMLAHEYQAAFLPFRRVDKIPPSDPITWNEYSLEYGPAQTLGVQAVQIDEESEVLIYDDLLATGGTAKTVASIVHQCRANVVGFAFLVELEALHGREALADLFPDVPIVSLIQYDH